MSRPSKKVLADGDEFLESRPDPHSFLKFHNKKMPTKGCTGRLTPPVILGVMKMCKTDLIMSRDD